MISPVRAAWEQAPAAARWTITYVGVAGVSALLGWLTPMGVGNALFVAGALSILASVGFIRFGSDAKVVTLKDERGRVVGRHRISDEDRRKEIRTGVLLFVMGLALWAWLPVLRLA